ncbi:hypothetical protein R1T16_14700 [Flavobacterium sp. DG1-102-2]|uniref:hypothetical protein n=1 Tax=Flavobacterium sp. DG1-102-2 TaxID=3081663 RepID=UPI0029497AF1|nr:hypothetical protein [Flavobacterium sp. DG1-102-2]MDV6169683.1 hypothetical protein [Flavobacterium sp. DG1-102-2]
MKKLIILLTPIIFLTSCSKNDDDNDDCKCKAAIYIDGKTGKEKAFYDVDTYCIDGKAIAIQTIIDDRYKFKECRNKPTY